MLLPADPVGSSSATTASRSAWASALWADMSSWNFAATGRTSRLATKPTPRIATIVKSAGR